jgi:hypothetical protein
MTFLGMRQTGIPGIDAIRETLEREFTWGQWFNPLIVQRVIKASDPILAAEQDTGNTGNVNILRPGLAMGTVTATKKVTPWRVGNSDGSENFTGFLLHTCNIADTDGSGLEQLRGWLLVAGAVKAESVCLTVETDYGLNGATDEAAFKALANVLNHIVFDDFDINL